MIETRSKVTSDRSIAKADLSAAVEEALRATPVLDIHTHLFAPEFKDLGLWGVDHLLTYHYLEAELFRSSNISPEDYWTMSTPQKADLIWKKVFVDRTPLSESARGVIAVFDALGLDASAPTLDTAREFFRDQNPTAYIARVFRMAGVRTVVMTNDPLDEAEAAFWNRGIEPDARFRASLRLDRIANDWTAHSAVIAAQGYAVEPGAQGRTIAELRRFLATWAERMNPVYMAVSLPDSFQFPADEIRTKLLAEAILPACRERNIPLSLMIGVRRQVNPRLRLAGDAAGRADMRAIERLCRDFRDNRFLVSVLSRENQHELCVYARKFANLMPFGCWWFLNNPSVVEEITRERLEMLGTTFIPQHSDARILEQLIYKWRNTRRTMGPILAESYRLLTEDGRSVTQDDVRRDAARLFHGNFEEYAGVRFEW